MCQRARVKRARVVRDREEVRWATNETCNRWWVSLIKTRLTFGALAAVEQTPASPNQIDSRGHSTEITEGPSHICGVYGCVNFPAFCRGNNSMMRNKRSLKTSVPYHALNLTFTFNILFFEFSLKVIPWPSWCH